MTKLVTATFKTREAAEHSLRQLEAIGVTDEQTALIVTDETRGQSFQIKEGTKMDEGAAGGATAGGIIGALMGALGTATAIAIPGLNIVVAGAAISALAGFGAGAATGGVIGALVGAGIPEHEAKLYENSLKEGSILLAIEAKDGDQKDKIKEILEREDAYHLAA